MALHIITINTEKCCDLLEVRDGDNSSSNLIEKLGGNVSFPTITSTRNFMTLIFHTDRSVSRTGFEVLVGVRYGK